MTIDDRLRGAYQRQRDDVRHRVEPPSIDALPGPGGAGFGVRALAVAAGLLVIGLGSVAIVQAVATDDPVAVQAGDGGDDPVDGDLSSSSGSTESTSTTSVRPTTASPTTTALTTTRRRGTSGERSTTTMTTTAVSDAGQRLPGVVAAPACPSGFRAPLELAELRYLGENEGWGRKDDLVDEQDGPFYFEAWEPGYPDPVTVEITLSTPLPATEIRVAQDPFTPVEGTITIGLGGDELPIELSGVDGWRAVVFANPILVDRFTITREAATANIMEVLVCVPGDEDG